MAGKKKCYFLEWLNSFALGHLQTMPLFVFLKIISNKTKLIHHITKLILFNQSGHRHLGNQLLVYTLINIRKEYRLLNMSDSDTCLPCLALVALALRVFSITENTYTNHYPHTSHSHIHEFLPHNHDDWDHVLMHLLPQELVLAPS